MNTMTHEQALQTLVNAIHVAQKRGAFDLNEVPVLLQAIEVFQNKEGGKLQENEEKNDEIKGNND